MFHLKRDHLYDSVHKLSKLSKAGHVLCAEIPFRSTAVLFSTFFQGHALQNALQQAENNMFVPEQLLRSWREQRPSSQGDLISSVGGVYCTGVDMFQV